MYFILMIIFSIINYQAPNKYFYDKHYLIALFFFVGIGRW